MNASRFILKLNSNTELARAFDGNDVATKENLHFDNQSNKLFSYFSSRRFLNEIENMYSVFLSMYRNTRERLKELQKAVETFACGSYSRNISRSPKLPLVFLFKR